MISTGQVPGIISRRTEMLTYFVILALGLIFIYSLRDGLLILQNRRDAKAARLKSTSTYIIAQNSAECKRFEQAG